MAAVWLLMDNPTIDIRHWDQGSYTCAAPYDTVLLGNENVPGGERPPNAAEIARECRDAGTWRFAIASVLGVAGVGLALGAVLRGRRRQPVG